MPAAFAAAGSPPAPEPLMTSERGADRGRPPRLPELVRESLAAEFVERLVSLLERADSHAAENGRGLFELNLAVVDDLHVVAPGVQDIERPRRLHVHAVLLQLRAHGLLVIDHESEVPSLVWGLRSPC